MMKKDTTMRQMRWVGGIACAALLFAGVASAKVTSDKAAAILTWPLVQFDSTGDARVLDTVIELSNQSDEAISVHCFYENANSHCNLDGSVCQPDDPSTCQVSTTFGVCLPGWNETDFRVHLTPRQPVYWVASEGRSEFVLDGIDFVGSDGSSNAGSNVPPVAEDPFDGSLRCIAIDSVGNPVDRNVLKGSGSVVNYMSTSNLGIAKYNAVGNQAFEGAVNDDNTLVLGEGGEYEGCSNVTILNHFFDGANIDYTGDVDAGRRSNVETRLVLVPCSTDYLRQIPGGSVVQYLVYNEFEQRFSTSKSFECQQDRYISTLDTADQDRSIFSVGVSGTTVGQTRARSIGDGMMAIAVEEWDSDFNGERSAFNVHFQGDREELDEIIMP